MSYLRLDELHAELEALKEALITCPECKGEGTVEVERYENEGDVLTTYEEPCDECDGDGEVKVDDPEHDLPEDDRERYIALVNLDDELNLYDYATEGEVGIPEDEFEDYARDLAESIGAIDRDADWPLTYIDWEAAANALKIDYTTFDFDGETYLVRSV